MIGSHFIRSFQRLPAPDRKTNRNKSTAVAEIQFQWEHQGKSYSPMSSGATMVAGQTGDEVSSFVVVYFLKYI